MYLKATDGCRVILRQLSEIPFYRVFSFIATLFYIVIL